MKVSLEETALNATTSAAKPSGEGVPFPWILAMVLRDFRRIVVVTAIGVGLGLTVALLRPTYYSASFSFIPQTSQDGAPSGLASLAGQFGLQLGGMANGSYPPQLYADLLKTREILLPVASDTFALGDGDQAAVSLSEFLDVSGSSAPVVLERTMQELREDVIDATVAARTTGAVTVRVRTRSPQVSVAIAQRLLEGLNRYNVETRQSQAAQERRFIEQRVEEARAALRRAEDAQQQFLQANRQYSNSPQLSFQQDRLQREVSLHQQVVVELAQQHEEARIREVRDTPVLTVLEQPALPALPDPRGRVIAVLVGALLGGFFGLALVLTRAAWQRQRMAEFDDSAYTMLEREWANFRMGFRKSR